MAHVLNRSERNQAFWKFLFFFLLSTALIVSAVYFDVYVPTKENKVLRDQVTRNTMQSTAQLKLVTEIEDINRLMDSLKKPGLLVTLQDYYTSEIRRKIIKLNNIQDEDSSVYSGLNRNVAVLFSGYLETTKDVIKTGGLPNELKECKENYEKAKAAQEAAEQKYEICRKTAQAANPGW